MQHPDNDPDMSLKAAVSAFALEELDRLVDRCVRRLKELDASGVYGGDFLSQDLWDEYCYEIQFGPHEMPGFLDPATAWAGIIHKIAADELQKCSAALRAIIVTKSAFRGQCGSGDPDAVRDEEILAEVSDALARRAGRCDLDLLGVDRFEHLVEYLSQGGKSICWEIVREICDDEGGSEWAYDIDTLLEPQGDLSALAEELAAAAIQDILSDVADESRAFFFLEEHSEPITKWLAQHDAFPFLSRVQARIAAERQEAGLS